MLKGVPKKYCKRSFGLLEKIVGVNNTQNNSKTKNDTVGNYWFGSNLDRKFDVRKQIYWAMRKSGRGFDLEFMKKSKSKKQNLI